MPPTKPALARPVNAAAFARMLLGMSREYGRTDCARLIHVAKTIVAVVLAVGVSMRLELAAPRMAMVTVVILMMPAIRLLSGGPSLTGHVESVARGISDRDNPAGATLLADVNPIFTWVRLAQRVPVRIRLDGMPRDGFLAAGTTCTVTLRPMPHAMARGAAPDTRT
ncbi:hypothetical protein DIE16_13545 [Burkholderia sp. Bp9090]|nr:hypothetical protein DIE16_13545 [Burkholderia sp. Bp9090]